MVALAPTLAYDIALTRDLPPLERAAQVRLPVQLIVGEKSPAGIHTNACQLTNAIPGATFVKLAGQDHNLRHMKLRTTIAYFVIDVTIDLWNGLY